MQPYRTLIVEDDPVAKKLFTIFVESSPAFALAGVLSSASVAEAFCAGGCVDLVLMDVRTAGHADGLEAAVKIKASMPRVKVIIVTSEPEVDWIDRAKAGGVDSFWYKFMEEVELLDVMRRTMAGESVYPDVRPSVRLGLIWAEELTDLQIKILRELSGGSSSKEIAQNLHLSQSHVNNNINEMLSKTGFSSRLKLACAAVETGVVIQQI